MVHSFIFEFADWVCEFDYRIEYLSLDIALIVLLGGNSRDPRFTLCTAVVDVKRWKKHVDHSTDSIETSYKTSFLTYLLHCALQMLM